MISIIYDLDIYNNIDNSNIIQSNKIDKIIGSNNKLNSQYQ